MHNVFKLVLFSLVFGTISCFAYDPYSKTYNVTVEALFDPLLVPLKKLEDETNRCMNQRPVISSLPLNYGVYPAAASVMPVIPVEAPVRPIIPTRLESRKLLRPIPVPLVMPIAIVLPKARGKDVTLLTKPVRTKRLAIPRFEAVQNPARTKRFKN